MKFFSNNRQKKQPVQNSLPSRLPIPMDEFDIAPRPTEDIDLKDPVALGIFYHELKYIKLATYYFSISASKGRLDGLFFYAISLRHGWGIPADPKEAVRLLLMVAEMARLQIEAGAKPQYLASQLNQRLSMASSNGSFRGSMIMDPQQQQQPPYGSGMMDPSGLNINPRTSSTSSAFFNPGSVGTLMNEGGIISSSSMTSTGAPKLTKQPMNATNPAVSDPSRHVNKSALAGLGLAIFELAMSFRQGWGVPKDKMAATYYLNMAAELGDVDAQMEMGEAYLRGDGVKPNKRLAAQWFRKAANQGARMVQMHWIWKDKYD